MTKLKILAPIRAVSSTEISILEKNKGRNNNDQNMVMSNEISIIESMNKSSGSAHFDGGPSVLFVSDFMESSPYYNTKVIDAISDNMQVFEMSPSAPEKSPLIILPNNFTDADIEKEKRIAEQEKLNYTPMPYLEGQKLALYESQLIKANQKGNNIESNPGDKISEKSEEKKSRFPLLMIVFILIGVIMAVNLFRNKSN